MSFHGRQYPIGSDALRMTLRLLIVFLICCWRCILTGSPGDDLNSPRQEVRDAAAKILRSSYTTPSRANWDAIVNSITNGMTKANLLKPDFDALWSHCGRFGFFHLEKQTLEAMRSAKNL